MRRLKIALPALALCLSTAARAAAGGEPACASSAFTVDDYFKVKRVADMAMTSDGSLLVYAVDSWSDGARVREVYLASLPAGDAGRPVEGLSGARDFAWIPRSHDLALLLEQDGATQVFSRQAADGEITQRTQAADSVESFRFAPDGSALAFTTRAPYEPGVSLYDRFRNGTEGILVDAATTSSHDFLNPYWHQLAKAPPLVLSVQRDGETTGVPVPGEPSDGEQTYFWSGDGRYLSVTFVADDVPESPMREERTSVGVFDVETGDFQVIARGVPPTDDEPAINYRGGEWIPGEHRLLIRRVTEMDPWVSDAFPDWTVADASMPLAEQQTSWRPIETYPRGLRFMPLSASEILLTNTMKGVHSLFALTPDVIERSEVVGDLDGSGSLFRFSEGYGDVAFVNESLRRPPEIYVSRNGKPAMRLTELNTGIAEKLRYSRREVRWESADGTRVSGWLLEPEQARPAAGWPMITHVHGGPAFPFPDSFAPYFTYWPYPLEIYAAHGIAVFLPNYRGTHTYGRSIAASEGDEPIEDIVSGVKYLVSQNVADPSRLGVSGHSHGALVGPLAMVRSGIFEASSFAEGVANSVVMYELMSGDANREIHDPIVGASLYEAPELYLKESADLQMEGIETASLFEAGAYMTALYMLGFPKAAERAGAPVEFIVYPQTGHNIVIPALQREAAERNLAWFEFWLQGCAPSRPAHEEWFRRWKALKDAEAQ
jgi:dipeptidyl aminopeptidase/acylaminoacyl peptidase